MNKCFFKGVETTIEKVYTTSDRVYHLAGRHNNHFSVNNEGAELVASVLKNPSSVYASKDVRGRKSNAYIERNETNPLVVFVRNGLVTAYRPRYYQIKGLKKNKRLY